MMTMTVVRLGDSVTLRSVVLLQEFQKGWCENAHMRRMLVPKSGTDFTLLRASAARTSSDARDQKLTPEALQH